MKVELNREELAELIISAINMEWKMNDQYNKAADESEKKFFRQQMYRYRYISQKLACNMAYHDRKNEKEKP